jgi:hypothetical protein
MQSSLFRLLAFTSLMLSPLIIPQALLAQSFSPDASSDRSHLLAQRISDFSPAANSVNVSPNTSISGQFDTTTGIGIDLSTVKVFVNGRDVTSQSTISSKFFTYRPTQPLASGQVQVRVEFKNVNGTPRSASWSFTVQQTQPAGQISTVTQDSGGAVLTTGQTLTMTMNGTAGLQGAFLLVQDSRTVREIPARETSSGVYTASLVVQRGDRVTEGVVLGRLRRQGQSAGVFAAATQAIAFNTGSTEGGTGGGNTGGNTGGGNTPPANTALQPRFTSHKDGDRVNSEGFTLVGQTRPNATVQVKIVAGASILGVTIGGQTLVDDAFTADANGRFQVQVPSIPVTVPGLRYRIQASAREGNQTSPTTQMTLRQE